MTAIQIKFLFVAHSSSGLGHSPLKAKTGVQVPYALPINTCINNYLDIFIDKLFEVRILSPQPLCTNCLRKRRNTTISKVFYWF